MPRGAKVAQKLRSTFHKIRSRPKEVQPRRIEVGMQKDPHPPPNPSDRPRFVIEKQQIQVESLSVQTYFPLICIAFCSLRLARPLLVAACFPRGPQSQDSTAQAALALEWFMSFAGLLGAALISRRTQAWVDVQDVSEAVKAQLEPTALLFLGIAAGVEILHQILAVATWRYFYSTGIVDSSANGTGSSVPLAYILVLFHIAGLVASVLMLGRYGRYYIAAWKSLGEHRAVKPHDGDDLEAGSAEEKGPQNRINRSAPSDGQVASAWGVRGSEDSASEPQGRARRNSDRGSNGGGSGPSTPRKGKPQKEKESANPTERPPLGQLPRAWLWVEEHGGEWVRVRVLRSTSGDGSVTVRLPGGNIVQTKQSLLRARLNGDEEPPPSAPAAPPKNRPSSATPGSPTAGGPKRPPRGPSKERPSSAGAFGQGRGRSSSDAGPSVPPGWFPFGKEEPSPQPPKVQSPGELWAEERLAKLRKELQELDSLDANERRSKLRQLQRELHPDKLPEELRVHAQPLFHFVQKEWEVNEALRAESEKAKAGGG